MSDYQLGEPVRVFGVVVTNWHDVPRLTRQQAKDDWGQLRDRVTRGEASVPDDEPDGNLDTIFREERTAVRIVSGGPLDEPRDGIVVGVRHLREGVYRARQMPWNHSDDELPAALEVMGTVKVYLVATDLRRNLIQCLETQVTSRQ